MQFRKIVLAISIVLLAATAAYAQESDARVKKALDNQGIKYTINDSGNFKVVYQMENDPDRSQLVFVVSKTSTYKNAEIREIWSIAAVLDAYPDEEIVQRLFTTNSTSKMGAWGMELTDDGQVWVLYTVKIPVNVTASALKDIIYYVAESADELELELLGSDEY